MASLPNPKKIPGLDGLRAIAILMVIVFHLTYASGWFPGGTQGVTVFFVISGFLITYLLCEEEKQTDRVDLKAFYYRRAFRIIPPALLYLLATAIFSTRADFWHSVLFVRNFFPHSSVNSHFWSLSVEEQFYFAWPALFILLKTNRRRMAFTITIFLVAQIWRHVAWTAIQHEGAGAFLSPGQPLTFGLVALVLVTGQGPILMGCFLALVRNEGWSQPKWLAGPLISYGCIFTVSALTCKNMASSMIPPLVAVIINSAASGQLPFLDWAPLAWVGRISYSLYLWQQIFCFESGLPIFGVFPFNVIASFAMASISYYVVEKPALRLRDRLRPKQVLATS